MAKNKVYDRTSKLHETQSRICSITIEVCGAKIQTRLKHSKGITSHSTCIPNQWMGAIKKNTKTFNHRPMYSSSLVLKKLP